MIALWCSMAEGLTLVYGVWRRGPHENEAVFSMYSARRFRQEGVQIVVYSDQPRHLPTELGAQLRLISRDEFNAWTAGGLNLFRPKLFVLRDALNCFGGACAFMDTDTYFRQSPERLSDKIKPNTAVMHIDEGSIQAEFVGHTYKDEHGRTDAIRTGDMMWNSGVVGLHESSVKTLEVVQAANDALLTRGLPQISEQAALGVILSRSYRLFAADDVVYHYWGDVIRTRFAPILSDALKASRERASGERAQFLYRYRPRLTRTQSAKWLIKKPLLQFGLLPPQTRASHACFAPGLPREIARR